MSRATVNGIENEHVDRWLAEHIPDLTPPFTYRLIAGGRSNLTYRVDDADQRRVVLRRPPLGNVLQSAHDMGREHRIIRALVPTRVPVPRPLAYCPDAEVNGVPFYVMEYVDGVVLGDERDAQAIDAPARAAAGPSMIDVLADLHAVDPDAVGLGDLGRRDDYVTRQLRRWHSQFEQSRTREIPAMSEVHRRLAARIPPQQTTGIVHGDYRLGNCLLADDGTVRAVLDWELCTLGDPLADLGWLMAYWIEPGESAEHLCGNVPTIAPGFSSRAELEARYAQRRGVDLSHLDFYVALAYWKLACIAEGVYARYRAGVMGDVPADVEAFGDQVPRLADAALELTNRPKG